MIALMVFFAGMTGMGCVTAIMITLIRKWGTRQVAAPDITRRLDEISDRLSRLEPAIDSMSVEVERISEAQRFTAKILTQRSAPLDAPPKISGSTTPH
jgi:hypothetical protein